MYRWYFCWWVSSAFRFESSQLLPCGKGVYFFICFTSVKQEMTIESNEDTHIHTYTHAQREKKKKKKKKTAKVSMFSKLDLVSLINFCQSEFISDTSCTLSKSTMTKSGRNISNIVKPFYGLNKDFNARLVKCLLELTRQDRGKPKYEPW